jgi:glycosyltransferase involved in cell wall biosynthesis
MYDSNIPTYQRWLDKLLSPITSAGIAISDPVRDFLIYSRALDPNKIRVICNGIPLEAFCIKTPIGQQEEPVPLRDKLSIPSSHILVAIVGRLHPIKGHEYFLEAAKQVLCIQPNVTFLIVGDGDLLQLLKEKVKDLGIESHVIFLGHCFDIPNLLRQIDIKVIASLSEGGPLTAFEAMAAGCAIVTTKVGVVPEILTDDETACFVPMKSSKAIAEKLKWLLAHEIDAKQMGKKAKEVAQRYDIGQTVQEISNCYYKVLGL